MQTAALIIIGTLVALGTFHLFAYSLCRTSAQADRAARRAHQKYMMRYVGGERPCVVCGEPSPYSLKGVPMHATCRELRDLGEVPVPPEAQERGMRAVKNLMDAIQRGEE